MPLSRGIQLEAALRREGCDVQVDVNTRAGVSLPRKGAFEVRVNYRDPQQWERDGGSTQRWLRDGHRAHDGPLIAASQDSGRPYKNLRALDLNQVAADCVIALNALAAEAKGERSDA